MPLMLIAGTYSGIIAFIELEYFGKGYISNLGVMHSVLGFVISLLLVFRTNTAYDRWWEGRKQWGALTNNCRSLAMKLHAMVHNEADREFFRLMIPNFAYALKNHLRENEDYHELDPVLDLDTEQHLPNQIASKIFERVAELERKGSITDEKLLLLDEEIRMLVDVCGACERIKNTPIPFAYSVFIKKFIVLYVATLPFGWAFSIGYLVIPVVAFVLFAFASLELIAEEIENPFGTDSDDLPIDQICQNIRKHVGELI